MLALLLLVATAGVEGVRFVTEDAAKQHSSAASPPPVEMTSFDCRGRSFQYPREDSQELQDWIAMELVKWNASANQSDSSRPEGDAATEVLSQLSTPLHVLKMMAFKGKLFRWASFAKAKGNDTEVVMQAVALVEQDGSAITVHGIVSRRSLLKDDAAVSGGGKALLASLLQVVHEQDLDAPVSLLGSPGDSFVDKLYRNHGMQEIGKTEDNYAKLQMNITAPCVEFMESAILCADLDFGDYASILWRLIPGSEKLKKTCAHTLPSQLFKDEIAKTVGLAK